MSGTPQQLLADKVLASCDLLVGEAQGRADEPAVKTVKLGMTGMQFLTWLEALDAILPTVPSSDFPPINTILRICREKIAACDLPKDQRGNLIGAIHVVMKKLEA